MTVALIAEADMSQVSYAADTRRLDSITLVPSGLRVRSSVKNALYVPGFTSLHDITVKKS
ncbi:MAG TPA: hypothetical protein VF070_15875 [Streptosporangiaceae bacterium]